MPSNPMRVRRFLLELFGVVLLGLSILSTISFLAAEAPQDAARKGWANMPATWEAGVYSHGFYYEWYLVKEHPFFFALSIVGVGVAGYIIHWLYKVAR